MNIYEVVKQLRADGATDERIIDAICERYNAMCDMLQLVLSQPTPKFNKAEDHPIGWKSHQPNEKAMWVDTSINPSLPNFM